MVVNRAARGMTLGKLVGLSITGVTLTTIISAFLIGSLAANPDITKDTIFGTDVPLPTLESTVIPTDYVAPTAIVPDESQTSITCYHYDPRRFPPGSTIPPSHDGNVWFIIGKDDYYGYDNIGPDPDEVEFIYRHELSIPQSDVHLDTQITTWGM
ncbi:hypothetical protein JXB41_07650 [Candidatus Woesearchaeota archaeon]|nr:hypothetical protein [Candidatus Woesearchaeota archaeon]